MALASVLACSWGAISEMCIVALFSSTFEISTLNCTSLCGRGTSISLIRTSSCSMHSQPVFSSLLFIWPFKSTARSRSPFGPGGPASRTVGRQEFFYACKSLGLHSARELSKLPRSGPDRSVRTRHGEVEWTSGLPEVRRGGA